MRVVASRILDFFSSLKLACVLLILLGLLTWLGTLEQVDHGLYEVQKKYFESFVLLHPVGPISIPLPGANLVLCTLFVNLLVGGVVRLRKGVATTGILIGHLGILLMLVAGFVKAYFSQEGHATLFEGQHTRTFESYYLWEIAVIEPLGSTRAREHIAPQEMFADATGAEPARLTEPGLPFDLEVQYFMPNCQPMPKGPMFDVDVPVVDKAFLRAEPRNAEAEQNVAGCYLTAIDKATGERTQSIQWAMQSAPWTVKSAGKDWAVELRHERYPLPFLLALEDFTKEDHPRLNMPKLFQSDVTVVEGGSSRRVRISMNEPLRTDGLVVYQASWGPSNAQPGDNLFSTFAVVRNPADHMPLYSCIVIAIGLVLHFGRKLTLYVRREARRA
jgi:cytochrome c biogenesis protein ResB